MTPYFRNGDLENLAYRVEFAVARSDWIPILRAWWIASGYLWIHGPWSLYLRVESCALIAARAMARQGCHVAKVLEGLVLGEMAWWAMDTGDFRRAAARLAHCYRLFASVEDTYGQARILRYQATLAYRRSRLTRAWELAVQALELLGDRESLDRSPMTTLLRDLGDLFGEPQISILEEVGYSESIDEMRPVQLSEVQQVLALVAGRRRRWDEAWRWMSAARMELDRDPARYAYWRVGLLAQEGKLRRLMRHWALAEATYRRCLKDARLLDRPDMEAAALVGLADALWYQGQGDEAIRCASAAKRVYQALGLANTVRMIDAALKQRVNPVKQVRG